MVKSARGASVSLPILDVPYYQQTFLSTCGSAALMMVMKYWDNRFEFSKRVEFQLWRKSNPFAFFGGTLQFGLAKASVEMGFKAEIFQKAKFSEYHPAFSGLCGFWENVIALDARRARVPVYYGREVLDVIREALLRRIPPIVFLRLDEILSGENVLHWLVVTGMDEENVYVNDPYVPEDFPLRKKKGYPIDLDSFRRAIATDSYGSFRLPPCAISIHK